MNAEKLFGAVDQIDSKYIEEAIHYKAGKKKGWMRWCAAAACLCIAAGGVLLWKCLPSPNSESGKIENPQMNEATIGQEGVTIPPAQFSLELISDPAVQSDMIGFFIYQGRTYIYYEWIEDNGMTLGEYLGTATGLIDEWTPSDGHVELAGSVSGDFYSVQGFDPTFMLCMKRGDGQIDLFICNTGITLQYGSELYEDRLHLSDNYISVQYEVRKSWHYSNRKACILDEKGTKIINNFISALNAAEFMLSDDIPLDEEEYSIYDKEICHMYFQMQNGMTVELRLFEGGYVSFQGILDVCVQIPEETFASLVSLFEN